MKYIILMCLLVLSAQTFAQEEQILYLDNNLGVVKKTNALYKGVGTMSNGAFELKLYNKKEDYHIFTAHYTDATLTVMNGVFISYFRNGNIENKASYVNGKPNGLWLKWDANSKIDDSIWYTNGHADSSVHYNYSSASKLSSIIRSNYNDSSSVTTHFDENEKLITPHISDTTSKEDEIVSLETDDNAEFPGGDSAMDAYFQSQFKFNEFDLLSNGTSGGCTVRFTVDKTGRAGNITNLYCDNRALLTELRYAILEINWLPASLNGRRVKAFKQITTVFYPSLSQMSNNKESKTYLDYHFNVVTRDQAAYYSTIVKDDNLIKYILTDVHKNKEIFSMHFTDSSLQTNNGRFVSLFADDGQRIEGNFVLGRKNGWWLQWNYKGLVTDSSQYNLGVKTTETKLAYQPDGSLMNMSMFDFNSQSRRNVFFDDNEVTYDKTMQKDTPDKDSVYTTVEIDAAFPGGAAAWSHYVTQAMLKKMDNIYTSGSCVVEFIVDASGKVSDVKALTMRGTDLARIAVNAIKKGPDWIPAQLNGKKVKAFRLQPVTVNRDR